jgi:hypothetical protein
MMGMMNGMKTEEQTNEAVEVEKEIQSSFGSIE